MRPIKVRRKLYEFYAAPITTFWAWTLSFVVFLGALTYVLLIRTPPKPTWLEWFLFAYVIAFGIEHLRKFFMSEMEPFSQKVRYFFGNFWNSVTMLAVAMFFVGFGIRIVGSRGLMAAGRVVLAVNSVLWMTKLLDYMSVHPRLGPYITMAGKMILNMTYIIVMLVVSLLAFGLARQSITYPNEDFHWLLVRNIFYKPYFMLYGEVYADEIDQCGDEAWDAHLEDNLALSIVKNGTAGSSCVPGYWIPPILMTFFLLVANILLMSMLIAIFNHIFDQTDIIAQQIWLFQRYKQVMEYESTPVLPPPLTPLSHVGMLIQYIRWKSTCGGGGDPDDPSQRKRHVFDFSLKLFLNDDQVEKLHDFEEDCMDDLARTKEHARHTSNEERIQRTAERADMIMSRVNDLQSKEMANRETLNEMDTRLQSIEKGQEEILDFLRRLETLSLKPSSPAPEVMGPLEVSVDPADDRIEEEASTENLAPLPAARRMRTTTVCGTISTDDGMLSPQPGTFRPRFGSHMSLDPSGGTPSKPFSRSSKRRPRHDEYTSITDSICFEPSDFRHQMRSLSVEQAPDSPNESDIAHSGDEERKAVSEKRKEFSEESIKMATHEEEGMADCELTDVASENDDNEEEELIGGSKADRLSTGGESKEGISFTVINEDESDPRPSPRAMDSPNPLPSKSL